MLLLRLIGSIILLVAALSLIHDGSMTLIMSDGLFITPMGEHWIDMAPSTFEGAERAMQSRAPWFWDNVVYRLLLYPAWLVFGAIGAAICYAGRKRRRTNIYAN